MLTGAEHARGSALARAALAGNPSDGYRGATLAVVIGDYAANVRAQRASRLSIEPESALVRATVSRFARELHPAAAGSAIRWSTSIPRRVGLGGSSAIVTATLRALSALYGLTLSCAELAAFALAVEVQELGIAAGLQDRVAQACGGLTFMDFDERWVARHGHGRYETLNPSLLPKMFIAYRTDAAADSGAVHGALQERYRRGDRAVLDAMAELGHLARGARDALLARDLGAFAHCVDRSFDIRATIIELDPRHVAMIDCARQCGASANYTGSGGAIVGTGGADAIDALLAMGCAAIPLG